MPDFPSAFAATCVEPIASPVTTPAAETLTMFGSCTVQVTEASGTIVPDPSCTRACKGSCALSARVEVDGVTTMAATCGVASGAVLLHDHPDHATTTAVASVRPILDMSPPLPSTPQHVIHRDAPRR